MTDWSPLVGTFSDGKKASKKRILPWYRISNSWMLCKDCTARCTERRLQANISASWSLVRNAR